MRKTKIVATLGPASIDPGVFRRMVDSGLDVARINLSHGTIEGHRHVIRMVRDEERAAGRPIGVLLDTAGPEVRLKTRDERGLDLVPGHVVTLGDSPGADLIPSIPGVARFLQTGHRLVIGDGNLVLVVVRKAGEMVRAEVVDGGHLGFNKKVTCPEAVWDLPVLTAEDEAAIKMGIVEGIDWIAASFIRTPEDVVAVRRQVESWGGADIPLMAKIETRIAMDNLDLIVRLADGLMVARGDLGVEYPSQDVPWLQKRIIDAANRLGKPVVTATQMLESMVHASRPTRAEVTDIAHAVLEGSDAVMLSEETAVGEYPVDAVLVMARTAEASEAHPWDGVSGVRYGSGTVTDAVCHAALTAADDLGACLIITATESGHTAQAMAAQRPRVPILAVTPYQNVGRRLTVVWGLNTQIISTQNSIESMVDESVSVALSHGLANSGDRVVVTAGAPVGESGSTNLMQVVSIGRVLLRGQGLGPEGEVHGVVAILDDLSRLTPDDVRGKIVVVGGTNAEHTPYMELACGIVAEAGGLTSHAAIIGITLGIPTVIGVGSARSRLSDGQPVTVDAAAGTVLQGPDEE